MRYSSRFLSIGASIAINAAILGVLVRVLAAPSKPAEVRIAVELEGTPISHARELQPQPEKPAPRVLIPQRLPDKAVSPNPPPQKSGELRSPPLRVLGVSEETPSGPATGGPRADGPLVPGAGTDIGGGTAHSGPGAASVPGNDGGATLAGGSGNTSGPVAQPVKPQPDPPRIEPPRKKPEPPALRGETRGVKPAKQPQPAYPADARNDGVEGTVVLVAAVDAAGRVAEVRVEKGSGDRRLDRAAEKGIRQWTYSPALKDGVPVKSAARVRVEFHLE